MDTLKDFYFQGTKADGVCMFCGKTGFGQKRGRDGKVRPHRQYHVLWEKVSWFRGDDEIVGKVCRDCKKNFPSLMTDKITRTWNEMIRKDWDEIGFCGSRSWHPSLDEYNLDDFEIQFALKDKGRMELGCPINDLHRGIVFNLRDLVKSKRKEL